MSLSKKKKVVVSVDQEVSEDSPASTDTIRKKKGANSPPRMSDMTSEFCRDYSKIKASGVHDMSLVFMAMKILVNNDGPIDSIWKDHALTGNWSDHRELHIKGDLLLIYTLSNSPKGFGTVVFVRLGSHSELFS